MGLIRTLFWFAVFIVATFAFTVLFEHGTTNYMANAQREFETLKKLYSKEVERKGDQSDKLLK